MCIAIYKPEKVILTKKVLKTCFKNNPHGAGFAFPSRDKKRVIIKKGYFEFREFWKAYRMVQNNSMLIHFRVATSGQIDDSNCHPWRITARHAMIHNGVLQYRLGINSEEHSDTGLFVKHIFKPIFKSRPDIWKLGAFQWLIEASVGSKNKIAVLDNSGQAILFNKNEGEEAHGAWFSNDTYKNPRKNIAELKQTRIEERPNGRRVIISKAGNNSEHYRYVDHPLTLEQEHDKIMKFAERQTGVALTDKQKVGPPTLEESKKQKRVPRTVLQTDSRNHREIARQFLDSVTAEHIDPQLIL